MEWNEVGKRKYKNQTRTKIVQIEWSNSAINLNMYGLYANYVANEANDKEIE